MLGLRVIPAATQDAAGHAAGAAAAAFVAEQPGCIICVASGASPVVAYATMARRLLGRTDGLRIVKLDEWLGIGMDDPASCEQFHQAHVLGPLGIPPERYLSIDSGTSDPAAECGRVTATLEALGRIDLAIIGIGVNGHVGLNEPGPALQPFCHVATLAPETQQHPMLRDAAPVRRGITLGMAEIMSARRIILVATGAHKAAAMRTLMSRQVSTAFPASMLWLHPDATCFCDAAAMPP